MKKFLPLLMILVLGSAGSAAASYDDVPFYIGAGYAHTMLSYEGNLDQSFADSFPGGEVFGGYRFHEYGALELGGYATMEEEQRNGTLTTNFQMMGAYISLVGIAPVHENLNLLADVGYMIMYKDISATSAFGSSAADDGTQDGLRTGLGFEILFSEELGLRSMAHYLQDTSDGIDYQLQYSAAVVYHF